MGSAKERCLLAILLASSGEAVSAEVLIRRLWPEEQREDEKARQGLHVYVSRLRTRLREAVGEQVEVVTAARTYRLDVDPEAVDLLRFQRLRRQAQSVADSGKPESAVQLFDEAEALWKGEPLAEFDGHWASALRSRWQEERRSAREARIGVELDLGRHAELVGELREMAAHGPITETAVKWLMVALYRSGRQGEALEAYHDARLRLRDELGLSPSRELEELHRRVLGGDRALARVPGAGKREMTQPPDDLPRDTADFTGRDGELAALLAHRVRSTTALPVSVIHGMPGVGKTSLAVHAAHLLKPGFPDGCLYLDMRAYRAQPAREPTGALAKLLRAVHDQPDHKPTADLDELASRWRDWTAQRRVLLVLDDVRDADQLRPLLPGGAGCRVLVTSRRRLADLEGAASISLDVLSAASAAALFARVVGRSRQIDADAVDTVVGLCGRHPLAIRIVASRLRHREAWGIHDIVDRLSAADDMLDELDAPVGLAAAFGLSYADLTAEQQSLFRAISLHPGPDITLDAAACLVGADTAAVRRSMEALLDCHLLEEPVRDRYAVHDLIRLFAARTSRLHDSAADRRAAVLRLYDYFLAGAREADRLAFPQRPRREAEPAADVGGPRFPDAAAAEGWLDLERANLLSVARAAADDSPAHARQFPAVLASAFHNWGVWEAAVEMHERSVVLWRAERDQARTADALIDCAAVLWRQGETDRSLARIQEAMTLYDAIGDTVGRGRVHTQIGLASVVSGNFSGAVQHLDIALALFREAAWRHGEADVLYRRAVAVAYAGRHAEALSQTCSALELFRALGDRRGELRALNNLGEIFYRTGHNEEARTYYEESLAIVRAVGGRQEAAILTNNLGNVCLRTGDPSSALGHFRRALEDYQAIGDQRCEADTLTNIGSAFMATGKCNEALIHFTMAEGIAARIGALYERQHALVGAGDAQRGAGRYQAAMPLYQEAHALAQLINAPYEEAQAAEGLGLTVQVVRGEEAARPYLEQALRIYEQLDGSEREAEAVRRRLGASGETGA
ncbi:AfsR/SARP family transcriptional regulator [Actinacidiphila yeochonensis]|uniref:AfsR/SARP family transcriptional regulator n=1 Tax=Actinacidiphila yeochonensis TaxID=89050 RepID=UPI0018E347EF|nr:tetratricopeptide repeat protein [Actinacidiphila yeochonensis]